MQNKKELGAKLKAIRKEKKITTYRIIKDHNLRFEVIKAIEEGSTNYTIEKLFKYLKAIHASLKIK